MMTIINVKNGLQNGKNDNFANTMFHVDLIIYSVSALPLN
jgi:hypothetical protein